MTTLLAVKSSASGAASVSNLLVDEFVADFGATSVVTRDVGADPLPHFTPGRLAGLGRIPPDGQSEAEAHEARALSDAVIAEVKAADVLVIGAPMYNFGMPAALKGWFDYLLRAGETFRYTASGPEGLLAGKRAIVIESRAGAYSEGPMASLDAQEPHIRTLLGFVGITDVTFVRAEGLAFGRDAALDAARQFIRGASAVAQAA